MKKILAILLSILMLLSFVSCGKGGEKNKLELNTEKEDSSNVSNEASDSKNKNDSDKSKKPNKSKKPSLPDESNEDDKTNSGKPNSSNNSNSSNKGEAKGTTIRLVTTNMMNDSGLLSYLLPSFEKETGCKVEVTAAASSVAVSVAKAGGSDLLLLNSKIQEEEFISSGYASTDRLAFVSDRYIVCGPKDDPAGVANSGSIKEAFAAISDAKADYVSRGDNSVTNKMEMGLWEAAGINPKNESWYISANSDTSDALKKANDEKAYVFTDTATYLSLSKSLRKLDVIMSGSDEIRDTYSLIGVNADAAAFENSDEKINSEGAKLLIDWLLSDEAAKLIEQYGVKKYGEALFFTM